ncbi:beta-ketoacyl synthase chain length factor [Dyadobacter chenwenxiniae]|uniref:Beta-ketoacyl synthase chain length factor n=1 Tax=Dyadobacter chenwenxiniae TaxID=2906456 RepID=A0A9X1PL75_9BACT|nr:beta-ketoacyl synthase chain length factor [Dyadobacter chenwenxiniae]MCF0062269.1 beta-ketoacyl synthase chain length factor [Dyadobacter chenwenxiniae]UON83975.1 beta-ketoacyl synthase chain length factor [Dyadobacter chenwenxiniae]
MYITDLACISPQRTFDNAFFEGEIKVHFGNRYAAVEPGYGELIPAGLLRRMGKAVRMGVGAGLPLIRKTQVDGIILGTANGGLEDCLKFLNQIVDYDEGTLTPTHFVQSTPNAVAGNLALMSKVTGYNTTHVHKGLAFEAALLDAMMLLEAKKLERLLVGSVEEISDYNHNIDFLNGHFKNEDSSSENLLTSNSPGSVNGEGATMFVAESIRNENTLAHIKDVDQLSYPSHDDLEMKLDQFLTRNGLKRPDISSLILGISGDNRTDHLYADFQSKFFPDSNTYTYKNMVGDYPTASAFATWMAVKMLSGHPVPSSCIQNNPSSQRASNVLIYNHYKGVQHSFILLTP